MLALWARSSWGLTKHLAQGPAGQRSQTHRSRSGEDSRHSRSLGLWGWGSRTSTWAEATFPRVPQSGDVSLRLTAAPAPALGLTRHGCTPAAEAALPHCACRLFHVLPVHTQEPTWGQLVPPAPPHTQL